MGNNAVKTIVLLMVLVVVSFIIGAQVSDNVRDSFGAFAIIGAVVGCGVMIYMGPRIWLLIFVLSPFACQLPIKNFGYFIEPCGFGPIAVSSVVMVYWIILWSLGRVRIQWRWAAVLDIPFWVFIGFIAVAYVRFPVALNVMHLDSDNIGGEEVLICVFCIFSYCAMSFIPITKEQLEKGLKLWFICLLIASAYPILRYVVLGGQAAAVISDGGGTAVKRIGFFYFLGSTLFFWAYSKYPVGKLLTSFRGWAICAFAAFSGLLSGQRQMMAMLACGTLYIACIKREFIVLMITLMGAYVGLLFMGEMDIITGLPGNMQRVLSSVPGLKVDKSVEQNGSGTMETRYEVWNYAMNPHTGVIKDYMWGDGFALSRAYIERKSVARMRGNGGGTDDNEAMCVSRNFHNAAIHTISRIGYVGLAWGALLYIIAWAVSIQVLRAWYRTETYPYIVVGIISMPILLLSYGYANYQTKTFMFSLQSYFLLKLCYCVARENGLLRPLLMPERYVPLMVQEVEKMQTAA